MPQHPLPVNLKDIAPQDLFPEAFAHDPDHRGWAQGGRKAALERLAQLQPERYGHERGHPGQYTTRLSPYLRHGVLSLAEVRDHALRQVPATAPSRAWKLMNELSWRDYFVRVYAQLGDVIWQNFTPYKTGLRSSDYAAELADDIAQGTTGLACVDAWSVELAKTGYLHNHVRMWFASYIVHHRRIKWQTGAAWMMSHFLDGDPAANNLNWQWVASTFRSAPYLWNRANLQKYVGDTYCATCPLREARCPFDASYAALSQRLFPDKKAREGESAYLDPALLKHVPWEGPPVPTRVQAENVVVWVHGDRLSPDGEALTAYAGRPAVFVWDEDLLSRWSIRPKRLSFLHECVQELPVHVLRGVVSEEVIRFARYHQASVVATTPSPSPRFREICAALEASGLTVQVWPEPVFARSVEALDLRSHASYWQQVKAGAFGREPQPPTPRRERSKGRRAKAAADMEGQAPLLELPKIVPAGLPADWLEALSTEFSAAYFHDLTAFLKTERHTHTVYPPAKDVFNALRLTPLAQVKVLILGQDPYHGSTSDGRGQANGLSFSVRRGVPLPPSLRNIYKELETDLPEISAPRHGDLTSWASQGALLLNAIMTVRAGQAGSHAKKGWEAFTDAVIRAVNAKEERVVFVLWGTYARRKAKLITGQQHFVIASAHPSPLSEDGFLGTRPFSRVNLALEESGQTPLNWQIP